jgi:hypothetical protein
MSTADHTLLDRWNRTRDADAFAELVTRYAGLVYGTCRRVLRDEREAEDVSQECFVKLAQTAAATIRAVRAASRPSQQHSPKTSKSHGTKSFRKRGPRIRARSVSVNLFCCVPVHEFQRPRIKLFNDGPRVWDADKRKWTMAYLRETDVGHVEHSGFVQGNHEIIDRANRHLGVVVSV